MNQVEKRIFLIFAILYTVGVIGFIYSPLRSLVVPLTPIIILASIITGLAFEKKISLTMLIVLACIGIMGFFIEYAGVRTGKIFGVYSYGPTLGAGWRGIPYLIGINWLAIIYFACNWAHLMLKNVVVASFVSAIIATAYDFLLEPVAQKYGFWQWHNHHIPTQNFIAWAIISFVFSIIYLSSHKWIKNRVSSGIFLLQFLFFGSLFIYLRFF